MRERSGFGHQEFYEEDAEERRRDAERRATTAEREAAARAPRKLRINVTGGSPGYVHASIFQSKNGVNWACSANAVVFDHDWFAAVFGAPEDGARYEFDLAGIHRVTD